MSHYDNPYCLNEKEFESDLAIVTKIKKNFTNYDNGKINLDLRALLNNIISFYNVFDLHGATQILEYRIEEKHQSFINSVLLYLNYPLIGKAEIDNSVLLQLRAI